MNVRWSIVTLLVSLTFGLASYSQCVPDTTITSDYYPPFEDGLPVGQIGIGYETVIYLRIPTDTIFPDPLGNVAIDSVKLTGIDSVPVGLEYDCSPMSCAFAGGDFGCIRLYGIPTDTADTGTHVLDVNFVIHGRPFGVAYSYPSTMSEYSITIKDGYPQGQLKVNSNSRLKVVMSQNPASKNSMMQLQTMSTSSYVVSIYSLLGSEVAAYRGNGSESVISMPLSRFNLVPGVYFAILTQGDHSTSLRFVLQ
ncbi:MAG: T9SS type A sorting domain-containing protein [Flavobacteriales bacterium]